MPTLKKNISCMMILLMVMYRRIFSLVLSKVTRHPAHGIPPPDRDTHLGRRYPPPRCRTNIIKAGGNFRSTSGSRSGPTANMIHTAARLGANARKPVPRRTRRPVSPYSASVLEKKKTKLG